MEIPSPEDQIKKSDEGVGPLIGIIIIVALFVAGGIYFLYTQDKARRILPPEGQTQARLSVLLPALY